VAASCAGPEQLQSTVVDWVLAEVRGEWGTPDWQAHLATPQAFIARYTPVEADGAGGWQVSASMSMGVLPASPTPIECQPGCCAVPLPAHSLSWSCSALPRRLLPPAPSTHFFLTFTVALCPLQSAQCCSWGARPNAGCCTTRYTWRSAASAP